MKRLLVSKDEWCWHENVARVLLQLKDRSGVPLLITNLKSKHRSERHFAAKAFAEHGDKSDVLLLGHCLTDEELIIQLQACEGLERITGVVNRALGQTMLTSADIPLWKAWFDQNKAKYRTDK